MPQLNRQVGTELLTQRPPQFAGFVVKGGTWKPKNLLQSEAAMNEDEEIFHHDFWGPGTQVDVELYQKVTVPPTAPLEPSMVIDEVATDANPAPGKWLVIKADPINFGVRGQRFSVTLERHDAEDLTKQTAAD